jgi:AcrR family transcriptional regulator
MGIAERKARDRERRRKLIQEAALDLFVRKGFASVKMVDIAESSEFSIATLYLYFKSKNDLYASLLEIALKDLHDRLTAIYQQKSLSAKSKILRYKDALLDIYAQHPTILRIIIHVQLYDALGSIEPKILDRLNHLGKQILNIFSDTYASGVRQGKFKRSKAIACADIIWSTFIGLLLLEESKRKLDPKKDFFETTVNRAFAIFCGGIAK